MTLIEKTILDLLKKGRDMEWFAAVRAEFEAEGAHPDEICRLLDLGRRADLDFVLKIGGCEAIRDLQDAKKYGADRVIAPMIESPYAAQKFAGAIQAVYGDFAQYDTEHQPVCLINIETAQGVAQHEQILASLPPCIQGVVFGRVDYVMSQGWSRAMVNDESVQGTAMMLGDACAKTRKHFVLGGGISATSVHFLQAVQACTPLWAVETRKIAFSSPIMAEEVFLEALETAAYIEYLWLQNKRNHYIRLADADQSRLQMLYDRFDLKP